MSDGNEFDDLDSSIEALMAMTAELRRARLQREWVQQRTRKAAPAVPARERSATVLPFRQR